MNANVTGSAQPLAAARAKAGLTQAELAAKAKVHPVALAKIETGVSAPDAATAARLARALGRKLEDLFEGGARRRGELPKAPPAGLLRALRTARGYAQGAAAAKAGLSPNHLSQIESGKHGLSAGALCRLAALYGVSADALARRLYPR